MVKTSFIADVNSVTTDMDDGAASQRVTTLEGAVIRNVDGSGEVTLTPDYAQAGTPTRSITVTYKALTGLTNATLVITPKGIVTRDVPSTTTITEQLGTTSGSYGYVYSTESAAKGSFAVAGSAGTITWTNLNLEKGEELVTYITGVNIEEVADDYPWTVTLDNN